VCPFRNFGKSPSPSWDGGDLAFIYVEYKQNLLLLLLYTAVEKYQEDY
jgi:hypothetical protein